MTPDPALRELIADELDPDWLRHERDVLFEASLGGDQPKYSRTRLPYTAIPFRIRVQLNRLRIAVMRRRYRRQSFPAAPVDVSTDLARERAWRIAATRVGRPSAAKAGTSRDLVLTHDLDELDGLAGIQLLRECEREVGATSAFGILSARYRLPEECAEALLQDGCEIFSHGFLHDGTDAFVPRPELRRRLEHFFATYPRLRGEVRGHRSGQLVRSERLYDEVAKVFDYDLTPPTVELGGPHGWRTGCATTHPFRRPSGLVHIPLTLPQDYFLAFIERRSPAEIASIWWDVTRQVWSVGGVAVHLIHPDNVLRRPGLLAAYRTYLQTATAAGARFRLPREVADEVRSSLILE